MQKPDRTAAARAALSAPCKARPRAAAKEPHPLSVRRSQKKPFSAWCPKPVERSVSDRHRAHITPRQVYDDIELSRWGPEQPLPVQDGDRDLGHPGSILPSGGG